MNTKDFKNLMDVIRARQIPPTVGYCITEFQFYLLVQQYAQFIDVLGWKRFTEIIEAWRLKIQEDKGESVSNKIANKLEALFDYTTSGEFLANKVNKPEIGILPRRLWLEERFTQLNAAIARYASNKQQVPEKWLEERLSIMTTLSYYED